MPYYRPNLFINSAAIALLCPIIALIFLLIVVISLLCPIMPYYRPNLFINSAAIAEPHVRDLRRGSVV